jgi:splicing factor 1
MSSALTHANTDQLLTLTYSPLHWPVDPNAPRKRRSRWGDASTEIPGLPTAISATGVSQAQLDNYAIHLRLEEINRKLRLNDFVPPERER